MYNMCKGFLASINFGYFISIYLILSINYEYKRVKGFTSLNLNENFKEHICVHFEAFPPFLLIVSGAELSLF